MRIEQLHYFSAITRCGSLRRASEQLHISQPALSEAVTKLERELGVTLLDRRRSGARISRDGRELIPYMHEVLTAIDRLRAAAGAQRNDSRMIRLGTVHAATSALLVPSVSAFQRRHPGTTVEVLTLQQAQIDEGLAEGSVDLGLVNMLDGDDPPAGLTGIDLVQGRPVVVLPAGHRLLAHSHVTPDQLREERFVMMRAGYLMHRWVHRALGPDLPTVSQTADGAEMGKSLVVDGVGVTVLPDYSVHNDPLHRAGLLETRPVAGDTTRVRLVLRQRSGQTSVPVRELQAAFLARAQEYAEERATEQAATT